MNNSYESMTVILPFQINRIGTDIWRNTEELSNWLGKELNQFRIGKSFKWKKIDAKAENAIGLEKAFENSVNLKMFYQNFTPEVAETLYSSSQKIIHFIATLGKESIKEKILGIVKIDNKVEIISCQSNSDNSYKIRKIHIVATIFGSCMLIIELHQKSIKKKDEIITENDYWDIENICKSFGIAPSERTKITFPTICYPYIAKLLWSEDCKECKTKYGKMSIYRTLPYSTDRENVNKDIVDFFSKTFECFWINVLQKSVAMYISSWASSEWNSQSSLRDIYEAYVIFDNQFNFLEISFNPIIQGEYKDIKDCMEIDSTLYKLSRQIDALYSINVNKKDEKRNIILAFFSALSLVTGCMQVVESFNEKPNICANITVGLISLIIGVVLFIYFIKN